MLQIFKSFGGAAGSAPENTNWMAPAYNSMLANQSYTTALVNGITPAFVSFTSASDASNLMQFAKYSGLSGIMLWELDQDVVEGVDTINCNGQPLIWEDSSVVAGLYSGKNN